MSILNWFYDFGSWLMKPGCYALFMGGVLTISGFLSLTANIIYWKQSKQLDKKKFIGSLVYTVIGIVLAVVSIIVIHITDLG